MKVFSLAFDYKRYQMIGRMPGFVENHPPTHANARFLENWEPLTASINNPRKLRGDFLLCPIEYFVCRREITQAFETCLRGCVQVLPVRMQGETAAYDLWNITHYVDVLDVEKTQFRPPPFLSLPAKWVFKSACLDRPMMFRTPHVPAQPLVATGFSGESDVDFYQRYHALGLKGLKFELLWES
jgi:hypothetical protein